MYITMLSWQPTQPMKFLATILTNKSVILTITVYILCGYICIIALSMGQQYSCLVLTEMEKDNSIFISYCSLWWKILYSWNYNVDKHSTIASSSTACSIATSCTVSSTATSCCVATSCGVSSTATSCSVATSCRVCSIAKSCMQGGLYAESVLHVFL